MPKDIKRSSMLVRRYLRNVSHYNKGFCVFTSIMKNCCSRKKASFKGVAAFSPSLAFNFAIQVAVRDSLTFDIKNMK